MHGGSSAGVNHHVAMPAQKYALDIVKTNSFGMRAAGLMPSDLEDYYIFGEKIYAPCGGEVIDAHDGEEDLEPGTMPVIDGLPEKDAYKKAAGNYILLECNAQIILFAHLKKGSVKMKKGHWPSIGEEMGEIGNSGNTTEPHLHVHAIKGQSITDMKTIVRSGEATPLIFDKRFLIRNDKVTIE